MKIAVIGAGIIGVTSAYELSLAGHEVSIFERRSAVAEESSFATGGVFAPGFFESVTAPGMKAKMLGQWLNPLAPVNLGLPISLQDLKWIRKYLQAAHLERFERNRSHLHSLAVLSQQRYLEVSGSLQLDHEQSLGLMAIFRTEKDAETIQSKLEFMRSQGISCQEISPVIARKLELALNPDTRFHSAIQLTSGGVGNCRQFALLIKKEAQRLGVKFFFKAHVESIDYLNGIKLQLSQTSDPLSFDAVLICAGISSAKLLQQAGLKIPIASVYGYSVSANIRELLNTPRSAIFDAHYQVSISRQGNRIRISGGSEIGGNIEQKREKTIKTLYRILQDWFPGAANMSHGVQVWKGARPSLPDGLPLIGKSGIEGLWLNLGHGSSGWALSCGSAKIITEMISGHTPSIESKGLGLERLSL